MDYSLVKKSKHTDNVPQTSLSKDNTPRGSPLRALSYRNTPSPDNYLQTKQKNQKASWNKLYPQPQGSTEQYTPLGISRSRLMSMRTPEDIDQLVLEYRVEIDDLRRKIGSLTQELDIAYEVRQRDLRKTKEEVEETSYLTISHIRQKQQNQAQVFELQIRKLKDQIADQSKENIKMANQILRQRQMAEKEKSRFQEEVRQLIEKKNAQIFELKQESDNKLRDFEFQRSNQIDQIRYACQRQVAQLSRQLEQKVQEGDKLRQFTQNQKKEKQKLIDYLEKEKNLIQRRYEQRLADQASKYENIRDKFNDLMGEFNSDNESSRTDLIKIFEGEYSHLMNLVKVVEKDNSQLRKQLESAIIAANIDRQTFREENDHLKQKIKDISDNSITDMELLKVKLAALHETDLKNLKELYEMKLKHKTNQTVRLDEEANKLREFTNILSAEKYELKKKYQITISTLNSRIMKMRMGMSSMQAEFKEKLDNQKSVMLMTSRSFMKEAEFKENNNKFLEEEIRKLRQLMDLQGRENENAERAIEERVLVANNQLERLSSKVLVIAKEKKDLQNAMENLRAQKDEQIHRLKQQLMPADVEDESRALPELRVIEQLKEELGLKKEEIGLLKDKIGSLQSRMKQMEAQMERLQMQNNMNTDQLKKQFHTVSEQHLEDFKRYYEDKLRRYEEQKNQLKKIVSSQYEQITQLVKKYKQTEEDLKEAVKMMRKRTELEERVLNVGLDVNLVKNMADLLPANKY